MTTTTTPTTDERPALSQFEGHDVLRSAIKIPNAGGGLRDALKVAPVKLEYGEEVLLVVRAKVRKVDHAPFEKDSDELVREHVLDAIDVALLQDDTDIKKAAVMLERNHDRVQKALDSMEGQLRLDETDDDDGLSDEDRAAQTALADAGIDIT